MILIYLEKEKKNDYWIGISLGLLLLTKHTIGAIIILFSFLSCFNLRKCWKRFLGILPVIGIFVIYLLVTKSFYAFIDLTVLGLLDFGNKNTLFVNYIGVFSFIIFLYYVGYLFHHRKEKEGNIIIFYALGSMSFLLPIMDWNHFACCFLFFLLVLFDKYQFKIQTTLFSIFLIGLLGVFFYSFLHISYDKISFNHYPHFFIYIDSPKISNDIIYKYKKEYPNSIMIDTNAGFFNQSNKTN